MGSLVGNKKANHNGQYWEKHVQKQRGVKVHVNNITDTPKLEIKSCQKSIKEGNTDRPGRFTFTKHQHKHLLKNGGSYVMIVHDGKQKCKEIRCSAQKLNNNLNLTKRNKTSVSWKDVTR